MTDPLPFETLAPHEQGAVVADDGVRLFTQTWLPDAGPRGVCILVHGYGEHSGRYGHVAQALVDRGVAVVAYDQRGYGRSGGTQAYVDDFDRYLDDLQRVQRHVQTRFDDLPMFLYGHSMGGLVVLRYALRRQPGVRGLVLSAPAIEINPDLAPLLRKAAQVLGRLVPTLPTVGSPENAISRSEAVVEYAKDDPLNYHGRVKARMGAEMLRAGDETKVECERLNVPFLLLHGTADTLTSPDWSRRFYERAASDDKTMKRYDGYFHELHNEPERAGVLADIAGWVEERV